MYSFTYIKIGLKFLFSTEKGVWKGSVKQHCCRVMAHFTLCVVRLQPCVSHSSPVSALSSNQAQLHFPLEILMFPSTVS